MNYMFLMIGALMMHTSYLCCIFVSVYMMMYTVKLLSIWRRIISRIVIRSSSSLLMLLYTEAHRTQPLKTLLNLILDSYLSNISPAHTHTPARSSLNNNSGVYSWTLKVYITEHLVKHSEPFSFSLIHLFATYLSEARTRSSAIRMKEIPTTLSIGRLGDAEAGRRDFAARAPRNRIIRSVWRIREVEEFRGVGITCRSPIFLTGSSISIALASRAYTYTHTDAYVGIRCACLSCEMRERSLVFAYVYARTRETRGWLIGNKLCSHYSYPFCPVNYCYFRAPLSRSRL